VDISRWSKGSAPDSVRVVAVVEMCRGSGRSRLEQGCEERVEGGLSLVVLEWVRDRIGWNEAREELANDPQLG